MYAIKTVGAKILNEPDVELSTSSSLANPQAKQPIKKSTSSGSLFQQGFHIETNAGFNSEMDSYENIVNRERANKLKKDFAKRLIQLLNDEYFEYGFENACDLLVKEQMSINASVTRECLNTIFIENFGNPVIVIGILRLVARFENEVISPEGVTMATSAIAHKDGEICDCGIRAFESWGSYQHLPILRNIEPKEDWLKGYLNSVIKNIEMKYDIISSQN